MLPEIIELQNNAVNNILKSIETKNEITFRAPTGSGKTYMMASFMDKLLSKSNECIFIVSTLSKGNLASQNHNKFLEYSDKGFFKNLNSHLINTDSAEEERLFIPLNHNVYVLPRDLYKSGGKLMHGAMENFLNNIISPSWFGGLEKKIILIKDECHIATTNLDSLSKLNFFEKTINISATPNLKRGQTPDVQITDDEAMNAKLIKCIVRGEDEDTLEVAINKFHEIKENYRNLLGVNPCMIIQISNKDKAEYELSNIIMPELNKSKNQSLKWMLIVDKKENCDTNDVFKAKKMNVDKWKDYAKEDSSTIDIIIFKMVITEGWDIPRACMLYQVRDTQSKQLDEQVIGRVRRNPRLLDFENLSEEAQDLASNCWVWGKFNDNVTKVFAVKVPDEYTDLYKELKIKTTVIRNLNEKKDFNLEQFIESKNDDQYNSIFDLNRKYNEADILVKDMCSNYSSSYQKWFKFCDNITDIINENNQFVCNYDDSMCLNDVPDENGEFTKCLPKTSSYVDNGNYLNIGNWVWNRRDGKDKYSFDSDAEREWASILKDLSLSLNKNNQNVVRKITMGKSNPKAGKVNLFNEIEPEKLNPIERFIWGKNFLSSSNVRFEYYHKGLKKSYPDFILKDNKNIIHMFEVKSVNISSNSSKGFDSNEYKEKIKELKKCYIHVSKLTDHIFYLPIMKNDDWFISRFIDGIEDTITLDQFKESLMKV